MQMKVGHFQPWNGTQFHQHLSDVDPYLEMCPPPPPTVFHVSVSCAGSEDGGADRHGEAEGSGTDHVL